MHWDVYQHKTVIAVEEHMLEILGIIWWDKETYVIKKDGTRKTIIEAVDLSDEGFDWEAYIKVTDNFIFNALDNPASKAQLQAA